MRNYDLSLIATHSPMLTIHIREFDALVISSVKLGGNNVLFEGNFNY